MSVHELASAPLKRITANCPAFGKVLVTCALAGTLLTSCSSTDSGNQTQPSQQQADSPQTPVPVPPTAPPTPAPVKANPDVLSGMVVRFYRDLNKRSTASYADLGQMLSSHFSAAHQKDWVPAYGFINDPKVSIDAVHDRAVSYTVDYNYLNTKNEKAIAWERVGTWYFVHGAATGWQLDGDDWTSVHVTSYKLGDSPVPALHDKAYPDGHHTFDVLGTTVAFTVSPKGWQTNVVATPIPAAATVTPPPGYVLDQPPASTVNPAPAALPPTTTGENCEDVDVTAVYHDGEVLELSDGRHLRINDTDTVTSALWTAPFDGLICKGGDEFINKDDNETVELQPPQ